MTLAPHVPLNVSNFPCPPTMKRPRTENYPQILEVLVSTGLCPASFLAPNQGPRNVSVSLPWASSRVPKTWAMFY